MDEHRECPVTRKRTLLRPLAGLPVSQPDDFSRLEKIDQSHLVAGDVGQLSRR